MDSPRYLERRAQLKQCFDKMGLCMRLCRGVRVPVRVHYYTYELRGSSERL